VINANDVAGECKTVYGQIESISHNIRLMQKEDPQSQMLCLLQIQLDKLRGIIGLAGR